jgi:hypothetical protein
MPISRRERTTKTCQNSEDLARAAVGCMGGFGALARHSYLPPA